MAGVCPVVGRLASRWLPKVGFWGVSSDSKNLNLGFFFFLKTPFDCPED